jgi:hypothetical protein
MSRINGEELRDGKVVLRECLVRAAERHRAAEVPGRVRLDGADGTALQG